MSMCRTSMVLLHIELHQEQESGIFYDCYLGVTEARSANCMYIICVLPHSPRARLTISFPPAAIPRQVNPRKPEGNEANKSSPISLFMCVIMWQPTGSINPAR